MERSPFLHPLDEATDDLRLLPYAARRALDVSGQKLSLAGWLSLPVGERRRLSHLGLAERVDVSATQAITKAATPAPEVIEPIPETTTGSIPEGLEAKLPGPLAEAQWARLSTLDRFVLAKRVERGREDEIARAYEMLVGGISTSPTHLDEQGRAQMVGVGKKPMTERRAVATARVRMRRETLAAITTGAAKKGDVLQTARIAGIFAAKRTHELIPLCHAIALTRVELAFDVEGDGVICVRATAEAIDRTGVEMEAMVAATTAALTIYDMVKAMDRWMTVETVQLEEKSGGRSGHVTRGGAP